MIDYFLLFSNAAAAQADPVVSAYWNAPNSAWDGSTVFPGIKVSTPQAVINSISSLTGFWIVVARVVADSNLDAHANLVMKLSRDLSGIGAFVLSAAISGSNRTTLTFAPVPHGAKYPLPLGQ